MSGQGQVVLIRTEHHEGNGDPAEQWIGVEAASALMLYHKVCELDEQAKILQYSGYHMLKRELVRILGEFHVSRVDTLSRWYLADINPPKDLSPGTPKALSSLLTF